MNLDGWQGRLDELVAAHDVPGAAVPRGVVEVLTGRCSPAGRR